MFHEFDKGQFAELPSCTMLNNIRDQFCIPKDIIDGNDAVRSRAARIVNDGCVALHPHPAAAFCQESIVFRGDLTLGKYWKEETNCERTSTQVLSHMHTYNTGRIALTNAVSVAHVKNVHAVDVVVKSFLDKILRFVASQRSHPAIDKGLKMFEVERACLICHETLEGLKFIEGDGEH